MDFSLPPPFPMAKPQPEDEDISTKSHGMEDGMDETLSFKKRKGLRDDETGTDDNYESKSLALSDMSDDDTLSEDEKLVLAMSCRDEGNKRLKEGDLEGAIKIYTDGVEKLRKVIPASDDLKKSTQDVKLALNLNLSLCYIKQSNWSKAIKVSTAALEIDNENVKGHFRRGVARTRSGFLEEARLDLVQACRLDPSNVEARKELAMVKQKESEARSKDKKAFGGLFAKTAGMYDDREEQMKQERKKVEEQRKAEMKEYEEENKRREQNGEEIIGSFDAWKRMKDEKREEKKEKEDTSSSFKSSNTKPIDSAELDEEDQKILNETKKMGYCYFNRKIDEKEKAQLQQASKPVKVQSSSVIETPVESQKALSSWNSKGTTYEEKDCSFWARTALSDKLKLVSFTSVCTKGGKNAEMDRGTNSDVQNTSDLDINAVPIKIKVTAIKSVEGDAHVIVLRASKRYLYDFKVDLSWSVDVVSPSTVVPDRSTPASEISPTYSGKILLSDVSSASSCGTAQNGSTHVDWLQDAKVTIESQATNEFCQSVLKDALEVLKTEIYNAVKSFEEDFKSVF